MGEEEIGNNIPYIVKNIRHHPLLCLPNRRIETLALTLAACERRLATYRAVGVHSYASSI